MSAVRCPLSAVPTPEAQPPRKSDNQVSECVCECVSVGVGVCVVRCEVDRTGACDWIHGLASYGR